MNPFHDVGTAAGSDATATPELEWKRVEGHHYEEAILGDFAGGDGVRFSLEYQATCYRRGPWRLLVEVAGGVGHDSWGCFDHADQPERRYHVELCARLEAQCLADVLYRDRHDPAKGGA